MIDSFRGPTFFLSNYYEAPVIFEGIRYGSSEAAFQAQKCKEDKDKVAFTEMTPDEAKKAGRRTDMREDWDQIKFDEMYEIVKAKFSQNESLKTRLLATGDAFLEEGNTWGDKIWGTVNGEGENNLGKILMRVRAELQ